MQTKLTLRLNKSSIQRAKNYAYKNSKSLSKIVEDYFDRLTTGHKVDIRKKSSLVKSLKGSIKISKNIDRKKDYTNYLIKKYN